MSAEALLNHLWQSTLVFAAVWLACATLLASHGSRLRYGAWLAASLKFLVPIGLLVDAGRWLAPRPLLTVSDSQRVFEVWSTGNAVLATTPFQPSPFPPQAPTWNQELLTGVLLAVWASGAAVVVWRWLAQWRMIRGLARQAQPAGDFRGIPVLQSREMRERLIEPGVFGLWRHTILLPEGIEQRLSAGQLHAILDHEWNHAQRRDNLTAWLHMIVQAIFWFFPVVWFVGKRLTEERELACDQAVLESADPDEYAEGILSVCKFYCGPAHVYAAGITGADLRRRVESILRHKQPKTLGRIQRWALAFIVCVAISSPLLVGLLTAQAPATTQGNSFVGLQTTAEKKFEVASIKANTSGSPQWRLGPPARGGISILNFPLYRLIAQVFRTSVDMVDDAPEWTRSANYDIVAKGPDPSVTNPEVWEMMRSLMIERFHLKYHVETRERNVYALTVVPSGHKLTPGEQGRCKEEIKVGKACGDILFPPFGAAVANMPIGAFITAMGQRAGRPIVDKTGLTGRYDVNITWLPEGVKLEGLQLANVPPELRPQEMSMFEALEKQGGLKLVPQRAPMQVIVVDSISKPDEN